MEGDRVVKLSFLISFIGGILVTELSCQRVIDPCDFWEGAVFVDGKCFKFFDDRWVDWETAQAACGHLSSNGRLAEPLTEKQKTGLTQYMSIQGSYAVWVGAKYDEYDSKYKWYYDNETTLAISYAEDQGCVMKKPTAYVKRSCSDFKRFICEQAASNPCDKFLEGAEYFKGSCFLKMETEKPYGEAQTVCRGRGAFLAEPLEAEVVDFLKGIGVGSLGHWLGSKLEALSNPLVWATSNLPVSTAITNTLDLGTVGVCLTVSSAGLETVPCIQAKPFVCQRDIGDPCELSYPGSVYSSGFCFEYILVPHNYGEAESLCLSKNGYLAELKTPEIEDFVINLMMYTMKKNHASCDPRGSAPIWIGLTHLLLDTSTRWRSDGEVAHGRHEEIWPAWHEHYGAGDYCAVMTGHGVWEQRACAGTHGFICQTEISDMTNQEYFLPLDLWGPAPAGSPAMQQHITVATYVTTHRVYLTLIWHMSPTDSSREARASVDSEHGFFTSFVTGYDVLEVRASHPVTLTLVSGGIEGLASTLLYPTLEGSVPWMSDDVFFVIASPLGINEESTTNKVTCIAARNGNTDVAISDGITEVFTQTLTQARSLKYMLPRHSNGYSITSSQEIVVFLTQELEAEPPTNLIAPKTAEQLPPLGLLSNEVIVLPSDALTLLTKARVAVGSVRDNDSYVAVPYTMEEVYTTLDSEIAGETYARYINNERSALDVILVTFNDSSQASSVYPAANAFVVQSGNEVFYSSQSFTLRETQRTFCTITPIPQELWGTRYASVVFPKGADILDATVSFVFLYLVVQTSQEANISVNGHIRYFDCMAIEDTFGLSGCTGQLEMNDMAYDKVLTIENSQPFAAYIFTVYNDTALTCRPMGFQIPPENLYHGPLFLSEDTVTLLPPLTTEEPTTEAMTTTSMTTEGTTEDVTNGTTEDPCLHLYSMTSPYTTNSNTYGPTTQSPVGPPGPNPPSPTAEVALQCTLPGTINLNLTEEETAELIAGIQRALFVEPSNTTMAKRKKNSAEDKRQSSAYIGVLGIVLFSLECALIIVPDAINIYQLFYP